MELQDSMEQQANGVPPGLASARALGATLREARESTGMSVEEVAGRLKFAPRQITALENGDFDQLPELAFIRGFVRSYARLLQLDEKPLLDMLPGAPAPAAIQVTAARGAVPRRGSERHQQNLFWLGGVLLVVVAGIIAWKYDAGDSMPTNAKSGATTAADAPQAGSMPPGADATQPGGMTQPGGTTPAAGATPAAATPQAAATTQGAETTQPAGTTPAEAPRSAATTGLPAAQPGGLPQVPAAGQAPAKAPKPAGQQAAASPAHAKPAFAAGAASAVGATGEGAPHAPRSGRPVRLEFDEDSWVEVKDGSGKILLSMLGKQGTTQNVSGPPPLSVVVGNAKGVRLFYKGAPVALRPMGGSEVARLKLE